MTLPPVQSHVAPRFHVSAHISREDPLRRAAQQLEASFIEEMLKSAGVAQPSAAFGGGIGEEQFASFLRQSQAERMVRAGGIGLAESLYQALKERQHG